ncbi:adenylate/guanylate cyclase [Deferribacter desulfuricans SSM1]|uniref:Adenylate/guanylate cyclase n=1 Tax=Deferribacter desulfuricans (strain DSM 14783 / JCM 11476 / NBRC 101012 / SSM1) TaxID=639282 RepID=D3PDX5_DEFDS|nr:adenylate/guanylate cyclase domain-containing protein [Deferribacter desulfuricans]BAI80798.1 adenylate/guanylate cyclase [Deferribacter desulfuricans SSM1]
MKKLFYFVISFIVIILTIYLYRNQYDFIKTVDTKIQDVKFRLRVEKEPSKDVVLVAIDGKSIDKFGRWPWDRKLIAKLINKLNDYHAKTIALDIVFSEPSNPDSDLALSKAIYREQNVILGYFFRDTISQEEVELANERLPDYSIENVKLLEEVDKLPIASFKSAETNIDEISEGAYSQGFFSVFPDKDGILRKVNLVVDFSGYLMPSLNLAALSHFLDKEIYVYVDSLGIERLTLDNVDIPINLDGSLPVNFYGKKGTIKTVSAADIIEDKIKGSDISNKLVFVGITETGVGDYQATPIDPYFPGTEIHCTVASNVLQNFYLVENEKTFFIDLISIVILAFLIAVSSFIFKKGLYSFVSFIIICVLYFIVNFKMFDIYNYQLSVIYPFISAVLSFIFIEVYKNIIVEQKSRYLKKAFSSYLSEDLVEVILQDPDKLKLGGEKKRITVLFSDIRGFTTISEGLEPETLVSLLNSFLGPSTDIILKNGGMLDKYIGDAIMAVFNAPIDLENHEDKAVESAIEIVKNLQKLNKTFKEKGLPELDIGIGINSGDAVVGNLGTEKRFDYTAIGDTVNLASRLEGLNKYYGTKILISGYTKNGLINNFKIRLVDIVRVKGKNEPVDIFEVIVNENYNENFIKLFEDAIKKYREQDFESAIKLFTMLVEKYGDPVSQVYLERIDNYINSKQPFDYVTVFDKK